MTTTPRTSPGDTLRGLLDRDGVLAAPGGGTPLEAHCAAAAGFEAFYLSGYAVAAWRHGQPDLGVTGMTDVVDAVAAITTSTPVSVIVDADTGYGDVTAVAATVRRLEQAGAADHAAHHLRFGGTGKPHAAREAQHERAAAAR